MTASVRPFWPGPSTMMSCQHFQFEIFFPRGNKKKFRDTVAQFSAYSEQLTGFWVAELFFAGLPDFPVPLREDTWDRPLPFCNGANGVDGSIDLPGNFLLLRRNPQADPSCQLRNAQGPGERLVFLFNWMEKGIVVILLLCVAVVCRKRTLQPRPRSFPSCLPSVSKCPQSCIEKWWDGRRWFADWLCSSCRVKI